VSKGQRDRVRQEVPGLPAAATALAFAVVMVGFVMVQLHHWRRGAVVIAGGVLLAAVLRLLLPDRFAGWLVVRKRPVDVAVLCTMGVAILLLAISIPTGP
jgi:hypothetical protein